MKQTTFTAITATAILIAGLTAVATYNDPGQSIALGTATTPTSSAATTSTTSTTSTTTTSTSTTSTSTTSTTTTTTSLPTTEELYPNPALYVSLDYANPITIGQPTRITLTCSRPLNNEDLAGVQISGNGHSFKVAQGWGNIDEIEPIIDGNKLIVEWTPKGKSWPPGTYKMIVWCTGYRQPLGLTPLPDGTQGPTFELIVAPVMAPSQPTPLIPKTT